MDSDRLSRAVVTLVSLMARLRGPGGCPWDAKQNETTLKIYLLEEAYEVLEAIERSIPEGICQELGDLLFQIVFLAQVAAERGDFDFADVIEKITEKMVRRHPHVFGEANVDSAEDVAVNWAKIKKQEKRDTKDDSSFFGSVPKDLPALLRAHRLSERASRVGFDWPDRVEMWKKVQEEFMELAAALGQEERKGVGEEMGDLLFSLVNLARHLGFNAENLLRMANRKFLKRFEEMEKRLKGTGIDLEEATPAQMDDAWEKVKSELR
jgi:MazG family protein